MQKKSKEDEKQNDEGWMEFAKKFTLNEIKEALPGVSDRVVVYWRSGHRTPPKYAQPALREWLERYRRKKDRAQSRIQEIKDLLDG